MTAYKVASKIAQDARARAIGMHKHASIALKATVEEEDAEECDDQVELSSEALSSTLTQHMGLAARTFWKNHGRAKARIDKKFPPNGGKPFNKVRLCYNCDDKSHFVADCPWERREDHGGRLVAKTKGKGPMPMKKPFFKKNQKIVLVTQEQYPTDDEDSDKEDTPTQVAALAMSSTTPSLFSSPNESPIVKNARCLMAKTSEVKLSPNSISHDIDDAMSLEVKEEIIAFDKFMTNLQGEGKKHFGSIMSRIGELEDELELKGEIEREDAHAKVSLQSSLEDEQEAHALLKEQLAKITKDRDLYFAKCKIVQNEKSELVVAHARLCEDFESLENTHKVLTSDHERLLKSRDQLQTRISILEKPSTSTPLNTNANVVKDKARILFVPSMATESKTSLDKGKGTITTPLHE